MKSNKFDLRCHKCGSSLCSINTTSYHPDILVKCNACGAYDIVAI